MSSSFYKNMTRYYREPSTVSVLPGKPAEDGTYRCRVFRGKPKACLATITDGTTVWFGISRCHENDTFSKAFARKIAFGRAESSRFQNQDPYQNEFEFDAKRLNGVCAFGALDKLLELFYNLDKQIYKHLPPAQQLQRLSDGEDVYDDEKIGTFERAATTVLNALASRK